MFLEDVNVSPVEQEAHIVMYQKIVPRPWPNDPEVIHVNFRDNSCGRIELVRSPRFARRVVHRARSQTHRNEPLRLKVVVADDLVAGDRLGYHDVQVTNEHRDFTVSTIRTGDVDSGAVKIYVIVDEDFSPGRGRGEDCGGEKGQSKTE